MVLRWTHLGEIERRASRSPHTLPRVIVWIIVAVVSSLKRFKFVFFLNKEFDVNVLRRHRRRNT